MISFLASIQAITFLIIFFSCIYYRRQLKLLRWKRKLSFEEMTLYVVLSISIPLFGISYFILLLGA